MSRLRTLARAARRALPALAVVAASVSAHAQAVADAPTGIAAVDSARAARAAWRRAMAAVEGGDLATARREADRAATAWAPQPAYAWARAIVAARQGDTTGVRDALAAYAALGLGRAVRAHPVLGPYASHHEIAGVVMRLDANRAPRLRGGLEATLADTTFWPEGMDADEVSGRYWVGSVRHRTVVELAPGRALRELWPRGGRDVGAVLGVRADVGRGVLWVTTSHVANARDDGATGEAALLRVRLADGAIERRWALPASERGHVLGDVALGPDGDVWVTDSQDPALYRLRPGADSLERLASPLFNSPQGMAASPDGRALYVADYSHGLLRVDVATGAVERLDDAPGSTSVGCDGIAWHRGAIVAVQNGVAPARVMRFTLDPAGRRIARAEVLDQQPDVADEPTIGAVVGDRFVYVANSAWEKYREDGSRAPGTRLAYPVLLAVPLR